VESQLLMGLSLSVPLCDFGCFCYRGANDGNDYTALTGDAAERFGQRDAEKFKFLGE